jgi:hypothetical protein
MPIEIKELHVRIQVNDDLSKKDKKPEQSVDELLDTCLDEVFAIMNDKKER